jgi:hypothetical protein
MAYLELKQEHHNLRYHIELFEEGLEEYQVQVLKAIIMREAIQLENHLE